MLYPKKERNKDAIARSSAQVEYQAMALATGKNVWLKQLLQVLKFGNSNWMKLVCDNQATMHIASNPIPHERTEHIEVDCHFINEKIQFRFILLDLLIQNQLVDILDLSEVLGSMIRTKVGH